MKRKLFSFKTVLISLTLVIFVFVGMCSHSIYKAMYAIFPNMRTIFNYSEEPIDVVIGEGTKWESRYKIPKAYFYSKIIYDKDGKISTPIRLWASIKDDMQAWTLSDSFKKRDPEGVAFIYIYSGFKGNITKEFPYYHINRSKERGGGINRGEYKKVFTRYDDTVYKSIMADGSIDKTLHNFFLIPEEEDFFIDCPTLGQSKCLKV